MSKTYDLEIIKATRAILIADNVDPDVSNNEYCIHTFIEDRVYQGDVPLSNATIPHITISFDSGLGDGNLPVEHGELRAKVWYELAALSARTNCRRCAARVVNLIDQQASNLNAQMSIIVRLCDKSTHVFLTDPDTKMYYSSLVFDVTFKRIIGE